MKDSWMSWMCVHTYMCILNPLLVSYIILWCCCWLFILLLQHCQDPLRAGKGDQGQKEECPAEGWENGGEEACPQETGEDQISFPSLNNSQTVGLIWCLTAGYCFNNNNDNGHLERLIYTGPKCLYILKMYRFWRFQCTHTCTHARTHTHTHTEHISTHIHTNPPALTH